ncbi:hypothetical protein LINPERPRIM_LOCUS8083 [Linum perenne]
MNGGYSTAATPNYCGSSTATDPRFPGYVDDALNQVIEKLVTENNGVPAGVTNPLYGEVSASANASCSLNNNINGCMDCLYELLPYVSKCRSYTTGSAYYDGICCLGFHLSGSKSGVVN